MVYNKSGRGRDAVDTENFITGQRANTLLKKDIEMNAVRQSYIFEGAEGIGKKTAAQSFAKAVLCSGENKPCGTCHSCRMIEAGSHPDFFVVPDDPVKIDTVREITGEILIKPIISDKKIFIIENADKMNAASQNAFLKIFEEPPSYACLILIASSAKNLLPTILSRGTKVLFTPFSEEKIKEFVKEKYAADEKKAEFLARYSGGIVGRAIDIMESEDFFAKRDKVLKAAAKLSYDKTSLLPLIEAFGADGRKMPSDVDMYFDVFMGFFRDVSAVKEGGRVINADAEDMIREFAAKTKAVAARKAIDIASSVRERLNVSMKYDLWITDMMINCWEELYGTGNRS